MTGAFEFLNNVDGHVIEYRSHQLLPFEPKGEMLELRTELRRRIAAVRAPRGALLVATLTSSQRGCDAENVLLCNVGTGSFARSAPRAIEVRRRASGPDQMYSCRYEWVESSDTDLDSRPVLARWIDVELPAPSELKVHDVWASVHASGVEVFGAWDGTSEYGIELVLEGSNAKPSWLAGLIKCLVDGVVSALHAFAGNPNRELVQRISARCGRDAAQVEDWLNNSTHAVLGVRNVVHLRGDGFQWNPADDACNHILLRYEQGRPGLRVHGTLRA